MRIIKSNTWDSFKLALENGIWGNKQNRFSKWSPNEKIVMFIENDGLALGKIIGKQFYSEKVIWVEDLYPWRIPIDFEYYIKGDKGKILQKKIKDLIKENYKSHYGPLILFGKKVPELVSNKILAKATSNH